MGKDAGYNNQSDAIAIGNASGAVSQTSASIAIGKNAGQISQGSNAIAIGTNAGQTSQGAYSICIGPQSASTYTNSAVINSSGSAVSATSANALYVAPIRTSTILETNTASLLLWNPTTKEIQASARVATYNKNFIINHPADNDRYLVHVCLEGPEIGIYYRGIGEITNDDHVIISLPDYVKSLGRDFTIHATPIATCKTRNVLSVSEVVNNQFTVYGDNGRFNWLAFGKRGDTVIEPLKTDIEIDGFGPYTWIKSNP